MDTDKQPTGLVLLNMGGPDSLAAVKPFLYNLFSDRELIQLPAGALLQKPFAALISTLRAPKVRENYRKIGGRTPLLHWTTVQAAGIARELGPAVKPYVAMRYWTPRAEETLRQMKADGVGEAVVLSMYPHYTGATTGSSVSDFRRAAAQVYPELRFSVIEQWYDWPGYLDALTNRVREGLEKYHELMRDEVQIVFSAHALPQKCIDRGDPYLDHVLATARGVMARVGERPWRLGFQSRTGPVKWMAPGTLEVLDELAAAGHRAVLLVPISFVSDHIETLFEIDEEFALHAHRHGITEFSRTPSLNDHADFIAAMAALVRTQPGGSQ
ncbi:MAG: ferrochelatase [Desulfuromonadales bacterium GWC2_61_20]|nr:MAG: ferrochelatase [Desulfuromonadales bacterium GWC2_61_20]